MLICSSFSRHCHIILPCISTVNTFCVLISSKSLYNFLEEPAEQPAVQTAEGDVARSTSEAYADCTANIFQTTDRLDERYSSAGTKACLQRAGSTPQRLVRTAPERLATELSGAGLRRAITAKVTVPQPAAELVVQLVITRWNISMPPVSKSFCWTISVEFFQEICEIC